MRSDAWKPEDDQKLIDTVLDYIHAGKTQLQAFTIAGAALGRTTDACGFRWNGVLRKKYEAEIDAVKSERSPKTKNDYRYMGIALDTKLHRRIKLMSALMNTPMAELTNRAIKEFLDRNWNEALKESM